MPAAGPSAAWTLIEFADETLAEPSASSRAQTRSRRLRITITAVSVVTVIAPRTA